MRPAQRAVAKLARRWAVRRGSSVIKAASGSINRAPIRLIMLMVAMGTLRLHVRRISRSWRGLPRGRILDRVRRRSHVAPSLVPIAGVAVTPSVVVVVVASGMVAFVLVLGRVFGETVLLLAAKSFVFASAITSRVLWRSALVFFV